MIGFISFGGGYAMIPVIEYEVLRHEWLEADKFLDAIAIAGMSPGPIATNSAIFVGYNTAGVAGSLVSTLGMIIPSLLLVVLVATIFYKIQDNMIMKSMLYGLRPIITGLILYAAISFAIKNEVIGPFSWEMVTMLLMFIIALVAMLRFKTHPALVIVSSGVAGAVIFV
jgi:chromate transporter